MVAANAKAAMANGMMTEAIFFGRRWRVILRRTIRNVVSEKNNMAIVPHWSTEK